MTNPKLLNRQNTWNNLFSLQNEVDRLFRGLSGPSTQRVANRSADFLPPVDVLISKESIIVRIDVPGLTRNEINLSILNNRLYIRGENKQDAEDGDARTHQVERLYGKFERIIDLPVPVNNDAIKASFRDGVLELTAPVKEEAKPRQIPLEVQ